MAGKFEKHDEYFESDKYIVTSAVGHLVEIQAPEEFDVKRGKWSFAHLPVIPPYFDLKPVDKTKTRLNAVVKLAKRKDVSDLVNACDAGREGELIFRLIEQYAGGAKPLGKPVKRLWLQSMTPQAIRDGFDQLRSDKQMEGLADAARSRSEADWLVGINGTRAMTAFNSRDGGFFLTTVGRVQTPDAGGGGRARGADPQVRQPRLLGNPRQLPGRGRRVPGQVVRPEVEEEPGRRRDQGRPGLVAARGAGDRRRGARQGRHRHGRVASPPPRPRPLLFDLTSLQREANGRFGFSAKTTLSLAQSLYERHKALTYPRTDSRALPEDYLPVVKQTLGMLADSGMKHLAPYRAAGDGRATTSSPASASSTTPRSATTLPSSRRCRRPAACRDAEQKLYDLVVRRFLSVFFPSAEFMVTTRISQAVGHSFKTEGKVLVKPGWLAIWGKEAADEVADAKEGDKGQSLVPVKPGEMVRAEVVEPKGLKTRPPARYWKPRCWAPWKAPARSSKTTSCAKPCRKKAWARRPRARPSSKA